MVQFRAGRKSPWQVQVRDSSGKVVTRSFSRKSDAEALDAQEKRKRQLTRAGLEAPRDEILLVDYSKTFLKRRFGGAVAHSTVVQDEGRLRNYWLEKFGLRALATITSAEIKEHLDYIQYELGHSPADRNRHRALMHTLFGEALADDKVVFNPVAKVPLITEKPRRSSGTVEPVHQEKYVRALWAKAPYHGMLAEIMLWTGLRIMAAAALQWRDVDFDGGVIRVRRLVERSSGEIRERGKGTDEGEVLLVPLLDRLRDTLLVYRKETEYVRPTDFIAAAPEGRHLSYEAFRDAHEKVLGELKIPRFTPHAIRKAFATNAKRAGYTRAEIREMLHHSTEAMTARYDLEDIDHLVEKGKRIGFGISVSRVSAKKSLKPRILKGGKR